jgi:hypothetical protein
MGKIERNSIKLSSTAPVGLDEELARSEAIERLKFQVSFSETVFRNLILVNGGAVIGLFTFIGNVSDENFIFRLNERLLWFSFGGFCCGVFLALLSAFGAFFSQKFFYESAMNELWMIQTFNQTGNVGEDGRITPARRGDIALSLGVVSAILSTMAFITGAALALWAVLPK